MNEFLQGHPRPRSSRDNQRHVCYCDATRGTSLKASSSYLLASSKLFAYTPCYRPHGCYSARKNKLNADGPQIRSSKSWIFCIRSAHTHPKHRKSSNPYASGSQHPNRRVLGRCFETPPILRRYLRWHWRERHLFCIRKRVLRSSCLR